jgi:hypothetical protein
MRSWVGCGGFVFFSRVSSDVAVLFRRVGVGFRVVTWERETVGPRAMKTTQSNIKLNRTESSNFRADKISPLS